MQFAIQKSKELSLPLKIIHPKIQYENESKQKFIDLQIEQAKNNFQRLGLDFQIINDKPQDILNETEISMLIVDFNPVLNRDYLKNAGFKVYEIDGHNIIPARFVSDKQEYSAATLRRKIYLNIYPFLTEFDNHKTYKTEADFVLKNFINNNLHHYAELKNNPSLNVLSGLSKYINLGFISSQRIALEVIKSNVSDMNKEIFLEELIVRKELADNFCLYSKGYKNFSSVPNWAITSLNNHRFDLRNYIYLPQDLETAKTHDKLWNAAQIQLINKGTIHGYLRMYWAKKILEWSLLPEEALKTAIYLNDKYAYDSPSPNGYTGILWAVAGLQIGRASCNSVKRKYDLSGYIQKYSAE